MNNLTEDIRSDLTKIFSERNEVVAEEGSQETYSLDEVINIIADTLAEADGEFIANVANTILAGDFTYDGDSIISATWNV
jgi:hypothetical protein